MEIHPHPRLVMVLMEYEGNTGFIGSVAAVITAGSLDLILISKTEDYVHTSFPISSTDVYSACTRL
jgi:hypothetical protein